MSATPTTTSAVVAPTMVRGSSTTSELPASTLPGLPVTTRELCGWCPWAVVARSTGSGYSASSTRRRNTRFHTRISASSVSSETSTDTPTSR